MVAFQKGKREVQRDLQDAHSCQVVSSPFPGYLRQGLLTQLFRITMHKASGGLATKLGQ